MRSVHALALALLLALVSVGCGGRESQPSGDGRTTLRLGFFPNITHATAIVGVQTGIFARNLGANVDLQPVTFNAGPAAVEAIFSGALDATYIGPNPAINAYVRSKGEAVRIISGSTSGGAYLIVKPEIGSAADLKGKKLATPQLGNTQDVALRSWLKSQNLTSNAQGGGDVSISPQENAQILETFRSGLIAGAWVPEPWATRLLQEGGGKVLVDERDLWPGGKYVTTHLMVSTKYLEKHPDVVERLLRGQVEANAYVNNQPAEAQKAVIDFVKRVTGQGIAPEVITASWRNLTFTNDPVASSLRKSAKDAAELGFLNLGGTNLDQIYDLKLLNKVLKDTGNQEVPLQ